MQTRHAMYALLMACGDSSAQPLPDGSLPDGVAPDGASPIDGVAPPEGSSASIAHKFTEKLGGGHVGHFLIGMGNDGTNDGNDDAYTMGVTLDLHYHYVVGISTEGGWPTWNSGPDYVGKRIAEAKKNGVIPMITYYCMAAHGDRNLSVLTDTSYMTTYFKDFLQMLGSVKAATSPVVVHHEPDFWGYMEQESLKNGGPANLPAKVSVSGATECATEPENVLGLAHCIYALFRSRAPNAVLGFHASVWGTNYDVDRNRDLKFDVAAEAQKTVAFFKTVGFDKADYVSTDISDRDAGCYEVNHLPMCECIKTSTYNCDDRYWDETNATLPSFKQHFVWAKALTQGLALPLIWWQLPFGEPSTTVGGVVGKYRDNRVHYFFSHMSELIDVGGVGAAWGTGAGDQTYFTNEYQTAVKAYYASPVPL